MPAFLFLSINGNLFKMGVVRGGVDTPKIKFISRNLIIFKICVTGFGVYFKRGIDTLLIFELSNYIIFKVGVLIVDTPTF